MINHNFKKKFGQNFIYDKNLLSAICDDAEIKENDEVLEIGAGAGTLTSCLAERAKKVVSYEIDEELKTHLLSLDLQNVQFIFGDIMNYSIEEIENNFEGNYKLIANLPYYITTPIIFKFLNNAKKLNSLTIMVQKEVAERIVAKEGNKDYGILSIMTAFYGNAKIDRTVSRKLFHPQPNVDSAVVTINIVKNKFKNVDAEKFYNLIKSLFSMRRKTVKNNLMKNGFSEMQIVKLDDKILTNRSENFNMETLIEIYFKIFE